MTTSAQEFLEGAMKLPAESRWRLGMRLLESLEAVADSGAAVGSEPDAESSQ